MANLLLHRNCSNIVRSLRAVPENHEPALSAMSWKLVTMLMFTELCQARVCPTVNL